MATTGWFGTMADPRSISEARLTAEQRGVLQAAFAFRQRCGDDYYSTPPARPFPAPLRLRPQGRPDRSPARHQPAHRLAPARPLLQGGDPAGPPPHGRPALRQAPAALCRPHRRVPPDPSRRHAATTSRLHRAHLRRPRLHGGLAPVPQEVRPRSGHAAPRPPRHRAGHAASRAAGRRRRPPTPCRRPARAAAALPLFLDADAVRGRVPADAASPGLAGHGPSTVSRDDYGSLAAGPVDQRLRPGRRPGTHLPSRRDGRPRLRPADRRPPLPVAAHASAAGGGTCPGTRSMPSAAAPAPGTCSHGEDALVSFDEHTIPRWTRKFHIGKGYVTTRNKYMRCEKLFYSYDLVQRPLPGGAGHAGELGLARRWRCRWSSRCCVRAGRACLHALFDAGAGKSDAGVRALWDLAEQHRQPGRHPAGLPLPAPGAALEATAQRPVRARSRSRASCVGAPPKEIRLAETQTVLKGESAGAGGADDRLPGGGARAEEGPLASAVHDQCGGARRTC